MNPTQHVCNYAILRYLPERERGESANVGVLVTCSQPCFWHFFAETKMPERVKAFFPNQDAGRYEAAFEAFYAEMRRLKGMSHTPKSIQIAFNETVRLRESVFRFGEPRTILTDHPEKLVDELFERYVQMKTPEQAEAQLPSV
jgi:hypothetical protein